MSTRITLVFDHPPCNGVRVDIRLPLPNFLTVGAEEMANRVCPPCPVCKQPMQYTGFHLGDNDDDEPSLNHPFPGPVVEE
jgi:hypothetical protein